MWSCNELTEGHLVDGQMVPVVLGKLFRDEVVLPQCGVPYALHVTRLVYDVIVQLRLV